MKLKTFGFVKWRIEENFAIKDVVRILLKKYGFKLELMITEKEYFNNKISNLL